MRPVFAQVVGELRAADPSNVHGRVKQNASTGEGEQSEDLRPTWKLGQEQNPGPENQDSQHMLEQPRGYLKYSEKFLLSQERVSGFPEKGADLRGSPGTSGEICPPGNLWIAVKFHSERTSGEVAENFRGSSGNFRGSAGTSQKLGGA